MWQRVWDHFHGRYFFWVLPAAAAFWLGKCPAAFQLRITPFQLVIGLPLLVNPLPSQWPSQYSASDAGKSKSAQYSVISEREGA
jgi:hypothetical protein